MQREKKIAYIRKLLPYVLENKKLFFTGLGAMLIVSAARLIDPLILGHIIDVCVPENDIRGMYLYAGFFVILIICSGLFSYVQTVFLSKLGIKIITKIKFQTFDHLLKLPVSYFDRNPVGELISRVESDSEQVKQLFSVVSVMIFGSLLFFVGMLGIMFIRNWYATVFLLIPIAITTTIIFIITRYLARFFKKIREIFADITGVLTEYMQSMYLIQVYNREKRVYDIVERKSNEKRIVETKAMFFEYSFWGFIQFMLNTLFIILIVYLTVPRVFEGLATIGTLIVFIQYTQRLTWPLMQISENINQVNRAFVALQRIFTILNTKAEEDEAKIKLKPKFNSEVVFKNVWFKYKEDEWVLKNVNFTIKKGQKVALVGASGSGKSTTVSLLCGFYGVQRGNILVDGVDIDEFGLKEWRNKVGLVLQEIFLFPGNVLENIRVYNDEISEDKVIKALEMVQMTEIIRKMDEGLYSQIMERGQNLSVGEKQLLSFARAIVYDSEIIIMDEATASVDVQTEMKIQQAMNKILEDKTALIVAHRLSSVVKCDKIILFQNGEIIAQGNHQELMEVSAEYRKLVELQFFSVNQNNIGFDRHQDNHERETS